MDNIIYGLRDPRTDDYWYVGKSTQGLKRPRSHIKQSHNEAVNEWIYGLREDNFLPSIDVLEECQNWHQLLDKERFWISKFLKEGHPLLNLYEAEDIFVHNEKVKALKKELKTKERQLRNEIRKIKMKITILKEKNKYVSMEKAGLLKRFTPEIFGKEVKRYRKKLKISRNKFAELAGLGKTVIYDVENAKPTCRTNTIIKIAENLGMEITLILPDNHEPGTIYP